MATLDIILVTLYIYMYMYMYIVKKIWDKNFLFQESKCVPS